MAHRPRKSGAVAHRPRTSRRRHAAAPPRRPNRAIGPGIGDEQLPAGAQHPHSLVHRAVALLRRPDVMDRHRARHDVGRAVRKRQRGHVGGVHFHPAGSAARWRIRLRPPSVMRVAKRRETLHGCRVSTPMTCGSCVTWAYSVVSPRCHQDQSQTPWHFLSSLPEDRVRQPPCLCAAGGRLREGYT